MSVQEAALENVKEVRLARPLKILVPLIKEDLEAAREAGVEHYTAAGEKLWEANAQVGRGQWSKWLRQNFNLSQDTAYSYMQLANYVRIELVKNEARAPNQQVPLPKTLSEVTDSRHRGHRPRWHQPVQQAVNALNVEQLKKDRQAKEQEEKLQRQLGLKLIDIGYKVLASKLHPDRGGSAIAMARLNTVRGILKGAL